MKLLGYIALGLIISFLVFNFTSGDDPYADWAETGYFKDDERRRVFLYRLPSDSVTEAQILKHAEKRMNTAGQFTVTVYEMGGCAEESCRSDVTLATGFQEALDRAFGPTMGFVAWTMPGGMTNIFNCAEQPDACVR